MYTNIKRYSLQLFDLFGGFSILHEIKKYEIKILMYHRFASDDQNTYVLKKGVFESQLKYLVNKFTIMNLTQFFEYVNLHNHFPRNTLIITIDDGYQDFYWYAYPVLKKYNIPATVFLPTGFIDKKEWMWQDKIKFAVQATKLKSIEFTVNGKKDLLGFSYINKSIDDEMIQSQIKVYNECLKLPGEQQDDFIKNFLDLLKVKLPGQPTNEFLPLTWDQIREMEETGIDFGAHTCSHKVLTTLNSISTKHEVIDSKRVIEDRLQHEVISFCYPNNNYNENVIKIIKSAGFKVAVAGDKIIKNNLFTLCRISIDNANRIEINKTLYLTKNNRYFSLT